MNVNAAVIFFNVKVKMIYRLPVRRYIIQIQYGWSVEGAVLVSYCEL